MHAGGYSVVSLELAFDREDRYGRFENGSGGSEVEDDLVIVEGKRANGGAVAFDRVVDAPAGVVGFGKEEGIVTNDRAFDEANAAFEELIGQGFEVGGLERRVAGAFEDEITGEETIRIGRLCRLEGGLNAEFRAETAQGEGGGKELGVGGGNEEVVLVEVEDGRTGGGVGDLDTQ